MAIDTGMTSTALARAKLHVYNVCLQGHDITFIKEATEDELGTALTETTLVLKASPVRTNPYDRDVIEKISWAENTDVLAYIPMLQLDNLSLTIRQIQSKYKFFRHDKKTYDIKYIEPYSAFANSFLYMIIGGKS